MKSYVVEENDIDSYQEHDESKESQEKKKMISEVLFFHPKEKNDSKHFKKFVILNFKKYSFFCSVVCLRLLNHLKSAKKTLDICVFSITSVKITECILKCHERGVKVRIMIDNASANIVKLSKNDIHVKFYKHEEFGHLNNKVSLLIITKINFFYVVLCSFL